jgi:hypothetical protein
MTTPEDTDPRSWHRFFGSSANNEAWALAELPAIQVDRRELLDAAHAAAWHWRQAGTQLNEMRALMLLAQAHAQAGLGETAVAFADEMRAYFLGEPSTPDWERAFTHVIHAHAAWADRASEQHAASYAEAVAAIAAIKDPQDRDIVEQVFRHVPAP